MFNSIKYLIKINLNSRPQYITFLLRTSTNNSLKSLSNVFSILLYTFAACPSRFVESKNSISLTYPDKFFNFTQMYHFNLITPNNHKIIFIAQLNMTLYYHRSPTQSMFSFRKFLSLTCQLLLFYP